MSDEWITPFEAGGGNRTTTWEACIAYYQRLAARFPGCLSFTQIGQSDGGHPIHAGVLSADGDFDPASVRRAGRPVLFNNNGIHPGEPEGIDGCMAMVRDLCHHPERLGRMVLVFIPVYNVDGALNRHDRSRVNQLGPAQFGFRGNARHLDLNRDFIKSTSRNAQAFARCFTAWDPDVLFDTHTSNGADYAHVVTLIATQPDKLGGALGAYLRGDMLPVLYREMAAGGWPMCPYVNPVKEIPDDGIADFLDLPRFSTGYAALHHCIGFMPETHMLKPFAERYAGLLALFGVVLDFVVAQGPTIQRLRASDRAAVTQARRWPLDWALDTGRAGTVRFHGYEAVREPSRIGHYQRLRYDRAAPYVKDIPYFDRYRVTADVAVPAGYLVPQAWREVVERLQLNGVVMTRLAAPTRLRAEAWRILDDETRERPFEGHHLHTRTVWAAEPIDCQAGAGDWLVALGQPVDRYIIETLEPAGADSFFRWGFFDAVLDRKETFSDYVFEDEAERLLATEPALRQRFGQWCQAHPQQLYDSQAVLSFLFEHCERYAEPECRRYPVLRILDLTPLTT